MSDEIGFDSLSEGPASPSEPVVKGGGDGGISDSEMETLAPELSEKNLSKPNKKDPPKSKEQVEATTDAQEEDAQEKPKVETKPDAAKQIIKTKTFKVKQGDAELELSDDALIPIPVDGGIKEVPLKDLRNKYNGALAYDKKLGELASEKEAFYTERETVNARINEFYRLATQDKNPRLAIEGLAEAMGADPKQVWQSLVEPIKAAMQAAAQMTPEEARAKEIEEELQYYRSKEDLRRQGESKARENENLINRIKQTIETTGMSQEQFKSCYDDMVAEAARTGFDIKNLTPEMVGEYYGIVSKKQSISEVVAEKFADNPKGQMIAQQLYDTWYKNPEFTIDDIRDIAVEVYGAKKPKNAKIVEKIRETKPQQSRVTQAQPALDWDEL